MSHQGDVKGDWGWWLLILGLFIFFAPIVVQPSGVAFYQDAVYSDLLIAHLPNARFIHTALVDWGQLPLWNPTIYAGAPFAADPLSGMAYLPSWVAVAFPAPITFNLLLLVHTIWSALGCYTLARKVGMTRAAGVVSGLAFAGTPKLFAHIGLGHISLVFAVSWTPWLLVGITEIIAGLARPQKSRRYAALAGGVLGLVFLADPRWSLPSLLLAVGYAVHRWLLIPTADRSSRDKLVMPGLLFASMACGVAALLALPLWQYLQLSTRADLTLDASNVLALDWSHLLGFFQPILAQAEQVVYLGVSVFMLAVIGVLGRKKGSGFWSVIFVVAVVFSLGSLTPLFTLITRWLPGAGFLRVPTRVLLLGAFAVAFLAGQGFDNLLNEVKNARQSLRIRRASFLFLSFVLIFNLVFALLRLGSLLHQLVTVSVVAATAMLIGSTLKGKLSARYLGYLWLILIVFDLTWVNWAMIQVNPYDPIQEERRVVADTIAQRYGEARVFSPSNAFPQLTATTSKLELADGVNPLQLVSYYSYLQNAVGFEEGGYDVTLPPFPGGDPKKAWEVKIDGEYLGRLNVVSVVSDYALDDENLVYIDSVDGADIYVLKETRPRAWVTLPDENAWIPAGIIQWTPNLIEVQAQGPGQLVLSEVDYPGWQADLDGQPLQIQVTEGLFRSVMIPEGQHEVTFSFHPEAVYLGLAIFSFTLLLGVVVGWRR